LPARGYEPHRGRAGFHAQISRGGQQRSARQKIHKAFDRVAWEKDFVLCEGSGHAGVGSVFDLSNAQVAKMLGCKVIIVTRGGIGKPIDEVALNQALFEKEGVEIIGVILNQVLGTSWIMFPTSRGADSNARGWSCSASFPISASFRAPRWI
jgi:cobyric acid synthase